MLRLNLLAWQRFFIEFWSHQVYRVALLLSMLIALVLCYFHWRETQLVNQLLEQTTHEQDRYSVLAQDYQSQTEHAQRSKLEAMASQSKNHQTPARSVNYPQLRQLIRVLPKEMTLVQVRAEPEYTLMEGCIQNLTAGSKLYQTLSKEVGKDAPLFYTFGSLEICSPFYSFLLKIEFDKGVSKNESR